MVVFGCHGNWGWSVTINTDAIEFVILINPLFDLTTGVIFSM